MTKSKKTLAAALAGTAFILAALTMIQFNGIAQAAAEQPGAEIAASANAAPRGDLLMPAGCLGETWPDISAECLTAADGSPAHQVRTVTIGYQTGDDTTVLVRMPAPQLASN